MHRGVCEGVQLLSVSQKACSFSMSGGLVGHQGPKDGQGWGVLSPNVKKSYGLMPQRMDGG